jgi:transposase-like protein
MNTHSETATPAKATLFCPSCSYQSRVDGGWESVRTPRATRYRCPDCGVEVTRRPHAVNDGPPPDPRAVVVTYWETVSASTRIWQRFWDRTTAL